MDSINGGYVTGATVVYRIVAGDAEFLGIFPGRKSAEENIALLTDRGMTGLKAKEVMFLGWGFNAEGKAEFNTAPDHSKTN